MSNNPSENSCSVCAADPVNTATGNLNESATDFSIPGRGPGLSFARTYNSLMASTEGPLGYGWTDSYAMSLSFGSGTPPSTVTVNQEDGSQVTFTNSGSTYAAPPRVLATLVQSGSNWTFVRKAAETFTFNSSGQLITETDLNGYSTSLTYSSGKLSTVTDQAGRTFSILYGTNGLISEVTDPNSRHTVYGYDGSGDLTSVTDPNNSVTSFSYGSTHLLLTMTPPNGQSGGPDAGDKTINTYDSSNRILTQTDPAGLETSFSYTSTSSSNTTTTVTDPHGNVTVDQYSEGVLLATTKGAGTALAATWLYGYDPSTLGMTLETDPNGNTSTATFYASGLPQTVVDADGNSTSYTYNSFDEPLTVTDPKGIVTTYTYNGDGDVLTKVVAGVGGSPTETTAYTYGDSSHPGDLTKVVDPDGHMTTYTYDTYGDRTSTTTYPGTGTATSPTVPVDQFTYATAPTLSAIGTLASHHGTAITTLSVSPHTVGNVLVVGVMGQLSSNTGDVTGMSGGGVTTWHKIQEYYGATGNDVDLWYGTVTTTGSSTITFTWSGTLTGNVVEYNAQEFSAGLGSSTAWAVDTSGTHDSPSSTTVTFPSLTPSGSSELYVGFAVPNNTGAAGSTSGFTYEVSVDANVLAYDTSVSGAVTPTATQSPADVSGSAAVLLTASGTSGASGGISAVGTLLSHHGTAITTLSVSPHTVGNVLVVGVMGQLVSNTGDVTGVSGGGVTTWHKIQQYYGATGNDVDLWYGTVTATGSSTITFTWSGTLTGNVVEYNAQEFTAGLGSSTAWAVDTSGTHDSPSSTTVTFPSLTPSGSSELYVGFAVPNNTGAAGSTSGFTYEVSVDANVLAYDTSVSSAVTPTATQSPAAVSGSAALLLTASGTSGGPFITSISPSSGPTTGGTSVAITGTGFTGTTSVKFGTATATTFTVNSGTSITATAPSGSAGTVDITVLTGAVNITSDSYNLIGERYCEVSPDANAIGVTCPAFGGSRVADTSTWSYDVDGNIQNSTDADGNETSYLYDPNNNQTSVKDPLTNVTLTAYDADNRVSSVTDGSGSSTPTTTNYAYDIVPGSCTSAPTGTTYCTTVENGLGSSYVTTKYYNALDQMIEEAPPSPSAQTPSTYTYDGVGNALTKSDGSGTASYSYNADYQVTGITYSNTTSGYAQPNAVTYQYDVDGNRSQMVDGTGTTTYSYDTLERLDSVSDGATNVVTYGYDVDNNVTCISYPNSGSTNCQNATSGTGLVAYTYDGAGNETSMTDWLGSGNVTSFAYDADGNLTQTTLPSGTTTSVTNSYDNTDALTDTSYKVGTSTTNLASLGRNVDELIGSTTPPTGSATTYGYDALNRVTTGTSTAASINNTYTYDLDSELTSVTPTGGSTTDLGYNTDGQLCFTATTTGTCSSPPSGATLFTYSSAGERLSSSPGSDPTTYGWDQAGNLVCETASNGSSYSCTSPNAAATTTYSYNGDGLRMSDTPAGGSIQQFTWNVSGSVPQLLEDGSNYYLYGPSIGSAPLEQITISGSTPSYLISDTTGVREQVGATGSLTGPMTYDSYGNRCSTCSISTPFGFQGAYTDGTGLDYLVHRYYDPATEQFLSVDPLVDLTGTPYAFTAGDPINGVDPSGLMIGQPDTGGLSIQSILSNPRVLQGLSPNEVQSALQGTPGWAETRLYQGSQKGRGLAIRELVDPEEPPIGDNLTGQMITWTPGSAHHPNEGPYWKVSCNQNQGPPERVSASEATAPIRIASDQSDGLGGDVAPELEPELEPGPSIWEILSDSFFGGGEED